MQIHFIAIGGAVMHQLALALHKKGYTITGSDDEINDPAKTNLANAAILPEAYGWFPGKIHAQLDAVVLGMHAKGDNPELIRAKELGLKVFSFPEYVYELSKEKTRVVIAGSHGKTTITSMVMHILRAMGRDFDYLVGAKLAGFDQSVQLSDAPIIILEGDEYPASVIEKRPKIFFYHPHISALNGIAWDHINVFPTYENYLSQFEIYLQMMQPGATLFYNAEDEEVVKLVKSAAAHLSIASYKTPDYHYENGAAIVHNETGDHTLSVFGKHNLVNLEAAIAVCEALGISKADAYKSVASFTGAARRLEKIHDAEGLIAFRDFAHAPSKLKATLEAVREAYPEHKLVACFELHTFSSLNEAFLSEYAHSMDSANDAIVYYSHHALSLKGLPALQKDLVEKYFDTKDLVVIDNKEELERNIRHAMIVDKKPVCLLLMSSGTFDGMDWNTLI